MYHRSNRSVTARKCLSVKELEQDKSTIRPALGCEAACCSKGSQAAAIHSRSASAGSFITKSVESFDGSEQEDKDIRVDELTERW